MSTHQDGRTSAGVKRQALSLGKVYEIMAEDDLRPLLILREFGTFDDPGNEKLSRKLYTEENAVLSRWFRCVRLPHHVEEENHPFHNLFTGPNPPQLLLASRDGETILPFNYEATGNGLSDLMLHMLDQAYVENPEKRIKKMVKLLAQFDKADEKIRRLKEEFDRAIESKGPRSSKARSLKKQLALAEAQKKALVEERDQLGDLPLSES